MPGMARTPLLETDRPSPAERTHRLASSGLGGLLTFQKGGRMSWVRLFNPTILTAVVFLAAAAIVIMRLRRQPRKPPEEDEGEAEDSSPRVAAN